MEVKEVFSLGPPIYEFQFVGLKDANSWVGAHGPMLKSRPSLISDSNTKDVAVPLAHKNTKKIRPLGLS
jgi:hypothetical protein